MRNRVKRRLREQFRPLIPRLKRGYYVVVARESAARADSAALCAALTGAWVYDQQKFSGHVCTSIKKQFHRVLAVSTILYTMFCKM